MDLRKALQTVARRHCMERHAYWAEAYQQLQASGGATKPLDELNWGYTDEAYATFPRYLVWQAILDEVERIETQSVLTADALREKLATAGWRAQTVATTNPGLPPVGCAAMTEERKEFARFVRSVPENQLAAAEPLQLRRVFGKEELRQIWGNLDAHWGVKLHHHWWPLREGSPPPNVVAFHTDWFDTRKIAAVREVLIGHGVDQVWELREFGEWGCEQTVGAFEPVYTGEEGYWTASSSDWLVYASHESSITLAGEWLVGSLRQRLPECDQFTYRGPMSTPDRRGTWDF